VVTEHRFQIVPVVSVGQPTNNEKFDLFATMNESRNLHNNRSEIDSLQDPYETAADSKFCDRLSYD
jgi:hypothetical protein